MASRAAKPAVPAAPAQGGRRRVKALYTIGYQGKTPEQLLELLKANGVEQLVDVRRNALSRKPGFTKKRLAEACGEAGIAYHHLPALGVPKELRPKSNTPAAYARFLAHYAQVLLPAEQATAQQLAALALERSSALLCFEADLNCCHRVPLAEEISRLTGLPVVHL